MSPEPATSLTTISGARLEYRLVAGASGASGQAAVILHGGHMSASSRLGEEAFGDAGLGVLVPSRPGYGRTELAAGPSVPEFVPRLAALCREQGLARVTAVGISLGARSALTLAAFYPDLVERVVLLCPVSFAPWPEPATRRTAHAVFNRVSGPLTWGTVHRLLRRDPQRHLPGLIASLSTLPGPEVVRSLGADRERAIDFLLSCRSGRGFLNDLKPPTDVCADVTQPTLILATPHDGAVSLDHARRLAEHVRHARLVEVPTASHLLWLGEGSAETARAIRDFLADR